MGGTCLEDRILLGLAIRLECGLSAGFFLQTADPGQLCWVIVRFVMGWLKHAFSILRIFTDFRIARLPM